MEKEFSQETDGNEANEEEREKTGAKKARAGWGRGEGGEGQRKVETETERERKREGHGPRGAFKSPGVGGPSRLPLANHLASPGFGLGQGSALRMDFGTRVSGKLTPREPRSGPPPSSDL